LKYKYTEKALKLNQNPIISFHAVSLFGFCWAHKGEVSPPFIFILFIMKFDLLLLLIVLLAIPSVAQKNYVHGTVTYKDDVVTTGYIDDQLWQYSPKFINFKDNDGRESVLFPDDILEFRITKGVLYKSKLVAYDSTSNKIGELSPHFLPSFKEDNLFLKVLVNGGTSLLTFTRPFKNHFFIENDSIVKELVNHSYRAFVNGKESILKNRTYVEQLRIYFKDCDQIKVLSKLPYTESKIGELVVAYNSCKASDVELFDNKEKSKVSFGFVAFGSYDQFRSKYSGGIGYGGGGFIDINFPN
jgi:hypothetical protein